MISPSHLSALDLILKLEGKRVRFCGPSPPSGPAPCDRRKRISPGMHSALPTMRNAKKTLEYALPLAPAQPPADLSNATSPTPIPLGVIGIEFTVMVSGTANM